jgi:hypothetical protein
MTPRTIVLVVGIGVNQQLSLSTSKSNDFLFFLSKQRLKKIRKIEFCTESKFSIKKGIKKILIENKKD